MASTSEIKNKEITNDINILTSIYNSNKIDKYEKKIKYRLLSLCSKINEITNDNNREAILNDYEQKIYTINGKILEEEKKITIALEIIDRYLEENLEEFNEYLQKNLYNLKNKKITDYSKTKKEIVKIQLLLDIDVAFYQEAYNLYLETFKNK